MAERKTPADLGLDLSTGKPDQLFKWFLASLVFGRPVQQEVATNTWHVLLQHGLTSLGQFAKYDREQLRALLDQGHYVRFDYIMTDELHNVMAAIKNDYRSVSELVKKAHSRQDLTEKLTTLAGVGPKTAEIFLKEVPAHLIAAM